MMFWRKKKNPTLEDIGQVNRLASRLGIERRLNPRMKLPDIKGFVSLPSAFFNESFVRMQDLSVGGCCLLDSTEVMGPRIGEEIVLTLRWLDGEESVRSRIVARIVHRRHIQFLDLPAHRVEQIRHLIAPGIAGLNMRPAEIYEASQIDVDASELWISLQGDSIVFDGENHRQATASILGETYWLSAEGWPSRKNSQPVNPREFEAIILFLTNIPNPSPLLGALLQRLLRLSASRSK